MDPVTAFGIVAGVAQLAAFGGTIVKISHEIYTGHSSLARENEALNEWTPQIRDMCTTLQQRLKGVQSDSSTPQDQAILQAATSCETAANALLEELDKLKAKRSRSKLINALSGSLKTLFKDDKIQQLATRVKNCQALLGSGVMLDLAQRLSDVDTRQVEILKELDLFGTEQRAVSQDTRRLLQTLIQIVEDTRVRIEKQHAGFLQTVQARDLESTRATQREAWLRRLLDSLKHGDMDKRENEVERSYESTFKWMLDPAAEEDSWSDFPAWLRGNTSIYWVSGKPGSGKSTLMKYLYRKAVRGGTPWSDANSEDGDARPIALRHFFWSSGSSGQSSLCICLRALLLQLIDQNPQLAQGSNYAPFREPPNWDTEQVAETLQASFTCLLRGQRTIYVFLDGLDECALKEQHTLLDCISGMSHIRGLKICASSRPENIFEDYFAATSSLRLQDLTRNDMSAYIRGKMREHIPTEFKNRHDLEIVEQIEEELCEKSDGVFLWTSIVVQDLIEGFDQGDDLDDLRKRLQEKERSLDALFAHLLSKVRDYHRPKSAKYLKLLSFSRLSLWDVMLREASSADLDELREYQKSAAMTRFASNDDSHTADYIRSHKTSPKDQQIAEKWIASSHRLKKRLTQWYCGLALVYESKPTVDSRRVDDDLWAWPGWVDSSSFLRQFCKRMHHGTKVQWIHRTAYDFVANSELGRRLLSDPASSNRQLWEEQCRVASIHFSSCQYLSELRLKDDLVSNFLQDALRSITQGAISQEDTGILVTGLRQALFSHVQSSDDVFTFKSTESGSGLASYAILILVKRMILDEAPKDAADQSWSALQTILDSLMTLNPNVNQQVFVIPALMGIPVRFYIDNKGYIDNDYGHSQFKPFNLAKTKFEIEIAFERESSAWQILLRIFMSNHFKRGGGYREIPSSSGARLLTSFVRNGADLSARTMFTLIVSKFIIRVSMPASYILRNFTPLSESGGECIEKALGTHNDKDVPVATSMSGRCHKCYSNGTEIPLDASTGLYLGEQFARICQEASPDNRAWSGNYNYGSNRAKSIITCLESQTRPPETLVFCKCPSSESLLQTSRSRWIFSDALVLFPRYKGCNRPLDRVSRGSSGHDLRRQRRASTSDLFVLYPRFFKDRRLSNTSLSRTDSTSRPVYSVDDSLQGWPAQAKDAVLELLCYITRADPDLTACLSRKILQDIYYWRVRDDPSPCAETRMESWIRFLDEFAKISLYPIRHFDRWAEDDLDLFEIYRGSF